MPALSIKVVVQQANIVGVEDDLLHAQLGRDAYDVLVAAIREIVDPLVETARNEVHERSVHRQRTWKIRQFYSITFHKTAPFAI